VLKVFRKLRQRYRLGPRRLGYRAQKRLPMHHGYLPSLWWAAAYVSSHVTLLGGSLMLLFVMTSLFALMVGQNYPMASLHFGVLAVMILDFLAGLCCMPRLRVTRQLPARVSARSPVEVVYQVENEGRWAARDLRVDMLPLPLEVSAVGPRPHIALLPAGERRRVSVTLRFHRRGIYVMPMLRTTSYFPFGMWQWGGYEQRHDRLVVHPSYTPLVQLSTVLGVRTEAGGETQTVRSSASMEFFGCREYREGDNPRHLHARSWARTGVPVVKEFQDQCLRRTAIVLDTQRPASCKAWATGRDLPFEAAVSMVAAVADYLSKLEHVVELLAAGETVYHFRSEGRVGYLPDVLDILASLEPQRKDALTPLLPPLVDEIVDIQSVIIVLTEWDPRRAQLVDELRSLGVEVLPVVVGSRASLGQNGAACLLSPEDVLAGRVQVL
jgi:uncharacterized protein (DUF58 family)